MHRKFGNQTKIIFASNQSNMKVNTAHALSLNAFITGNDLEIWLTCSKQQQLLKSRGYWPKLEIFVDLIDRVPYIPIGQY